MRLNLHDYSGHPFQVELSRYLAGRGHEVLHGYAMQYITGHGNLTVSPEDPSTLRIEGLRAEREMHKYDPVGRARFEFSYAKAWREQLDREDFDVVVACNVPLFALAAMRQYFARRRQPWVLWHQDIYSLGVGAEAGRRLPQPLSGAAKAQFERMERAQVRSADRVVAIGDGFVQQYQRWGLNADHVTVIPNWAPLQELTPGPRDNAWTQRMGIPSEPVRLLYAGTLGRKHNPMLLLELLDKVKARGVDAILLVCSEGVVADFLQEQAGDRTDVRVLGFQPAEDFSDVLASADAVIAVLEPDAAEFCVPSKVLSHMCAGRPTIALMPESNASANDVRFTGGYVGAPTPEGADGAAAWLAAARADETALARIGHACRNFAETRFDINTIGQRFEEILAEVAQRPVGLDDGTPLAIVTEDGVPNVA
ncbi:glycosyltransferase family 4 protein [Jatrophihabitans sp.]|uniref:glycosyltransferase family 4 protein n=1 Tax=Jatrophihabitans sp. TaxID=1932789 RepID=UPI0030C6BEBC|nr:glycosyltransferase WbuB [Jatrophihabitans sp.]